MFEVGQKVWDVVRGEGVVTRIISWQIYPVIVVLDNGSSESYTPDGKYQEEHENISLYPYPVEVVKKITKPSINWEHVRSVFNYLAQDEDGSAWLYSEKPESDVDGWDVTQGECSTVHSLAATQPAAQGMEKDAARYQWLRKSPNPACDIALAKHFGGGRGQDFDALIDAAIAAQAKQKG